MHSKYLLTAALSLVLSAPMAAPPAEARPGAIIPAARRANFPGARHMVSHNGAIYTIEKGSLVRTHPSGLHEYLGVKGDFVGTTDMISTGSELLVADDDRTIYRVLPDGRRDAIGEQYFTNTRYLTVLDGELYGMELDGSLYRISAEGALTPIGPASIWTKVERLFSHRGLLWAVDHGTLYRADRTVKWRQVGGIGAWKSATHMVPFRDKIWIIAHGDLFTLDRNGRKAVVGRRRWRNVSAMAVHNGALYAIEKNGNMFITATR